MPAVKAGSNTTESPLRLRIPLLPTLTYLHALTLAISASSSSHGRMVASRLLQIEVSAGRLQPGEDTSTGARCSVDAVARPRSARRVASPLAGLLRAGEEAVDAVGEDGFRADVVFAVEASVGGGLFGVDRSVLLVGGHGGGERAADH